MLQSLVIWQLNVNKSNEAQLAFVHDPIISNATILAFQEPYLDHKGKSRFPPLWSTIYPTTHARKDTPRSRSFLAINPMLSTNDWEQVDCDSADVTAIRLGTDKGIILIINAYNPCDSNATIPHIETLLKGAAKGEQVILLGDFNRHHPLWDEDRNAHLFTTANLDLAQELIDLTGAHGLDMALPKDIPTLEATRTKNHTRPDNVFLAPDLMQDLVCCNTHPDRRPPHTDHFPIYTEIQTLPTFAPSRKVRNFKKMDEKVLRKALEEGLAVVDLSAPIYGQDGLDARVDQLMEIIENAVEKSVPALRLDIRSKRWWSKALTKFRKKVRNLAARSYRARRQTEDPVHGLFRATRNLYAQAIKDAKRKHWETFLEGLDENTMWSAASYIGDEGKDGGRTRIPSLRFKTEEGEERTAQDNATKSQVLLDSFFPPPPEENNAPGPKAPSPVPDLPELTIDDVTAAIQGLKPHKAPGPDDIPACVYIAGSDLLAPHLLAVYQASLKKGLYPTAWKHSRTAVLRKPGKPDYAVAKAYRPIALLNVIGKILSSCVAKRLITLADKHGWIPAHHFGGRAGRTTTDALHLLVKRVKDAWARGEVASALFLDVKGAFPHADPNRLAENMRLLGVPRGYIRWTLAKLRGRTTCLAFDDFMSDPLPILNGIDQGCPLSVIYYLIYNSPLIRIPNHRRELCVAYIDDITLMVWGKSPEANNKRLLAMMERRGGALDWSRSHNSTFELDKTALIHFTRRKDLDQPSLTIGAQTIEPVRAHTLLGVILDRELRFREQCHKALAKGLLWSSQLSRLAKMSYGAPMKIARMLYLSIAVPRFTYAADVWYTPVEYQDGMKRASGSVGFARKLARVQSTAARAILGAMKSTPVDHLDAFASLLPVPMLLNQVCVRAAIRLVSTPEGHPLRKDVVKSLVGRKTHIPPLQRILSTVDVWADRIERWTFKDCERKALTVPPKYFLPVNSALMEVKTGQSRVKVYADGSRNKEGVGAAAVIKVHGRMAASSGLRLGDSQVCSILEAEIAAILLATQLILRLRYIEDATIYTDSQLAIACVEGVAYGAPRRLVAGVRKAMDRIKERKDCTGLHLT
ncbi:hypothetical protein FRC07_003847, partial [Ceratobasidium sp. 392]